MRQDVMEVDHVAKNQDRRAFGLTAIFGKLDERGNEGVLIVAGGIRDGDGVRGVY